MKSIQNTTPASKSSSGQSLPIQRPILILGLGTFAVGTDAFIVSGFLPAMAQTLSVSSAWAGMSITAFALSYALLAPVVAAATASIPRRKLLIGALVVLGLANLASAIAPTLGLLIATRVLAAVGAAAYTPNAGAAAAALAPQSQRARALALVIGGLTAATALGVPLGRAASLAMSWRASLALVGAISLLAAAAIAGVMPWLPGQAAISLPSRLKVLSHPGVMVILPLTLLGMAACYTPYAFTVQVLSALKISPDWVVTQLICYGLGAIVGNQMSGRLTDRFSERHVLVAAYASMVIVLAGFAAIAEAPAASDAIAVMLLMAGWGASSWAQTPAQQHRLIGATPEQAPLVVALNSSCIYLGISLGTAIGSATIGHGIPLLLWTACCVALAALVYAVATIPRRRP
jgi:predicted MFS family arabinose efflux permease